MEIDGKIYFLLLLAFCVLIASSDSSLEYDYYRESCPQADRVIRSTLRRIYDQNPSVAPAILRLVFHDCFVQGCDASVLLDKTDEMESEKDTPPNESLKGFDSIDIIKSELENVCPGVVSCADLLVVAARESVILAGGPFYPLRMGRKDSNRSFAQTAFELPAPLDDLSKNLAKFASRGFNEKETVVLLGAHSTGTIHCKFFEPRLNNFNNTSQPDPTLDVQFAELLRSTCNIPNSPSLASSTSPSPSPSSSSQTRQLPNSASLASSTSPSASPSPSPSPSSSSQTRQLPNSASLASSTSPSPSPSPSPSSSSQTRQLRGMKMDYEGPGSGFGTLYYRSLLQDRGILFVDQQLIYGPATLAWVRHYASDVSSFHRDFAQAMMKLSDTQVLTGANGHVRRSCRKVGS